jgi:SlyX protein
MNDVKTNDVKALGDRVDALETRLTFQDETIETLNQTITAQWLKIDALTRQIASLSERLEQAGADAPAADETPPHY